MPLDTTGLRPLDTSGLRPLGSGGEAGGWGLDTSGLTRLDTSGLTPMEPEGPGAISRGFVSGLLQQNPELASEAMEGLSHLAPEQLRGAFGDASRSLREWSQMSPEEYAPRARSLWESESLGEALTWAGEAFGQGIASTVPSIITGTAGAVTGGRVGGRAGGLVGGAAGAAVPSAALNYGEVYRALKEEGVDPERAAEVGAYAAVPMVALDTLSIGPIITRLGGIDKVRQEASRRIARRIAQEAARGAGREGITEAAQDVIKEIAVSIETDQPFWTVENLGEFVESGIAGAMVGGTLGGAAGIRPDQQAATQAPPTFQPGDRVQWIGDEGKSFAGTVTAVGRGGNVYQVQRDDGNTAMVGSSYLSAAGAPVEITPDDAASPLPTDAIRQGKEIIQDALEGRQRPEAPVEAPVDLPQGAVPADVLLGAEVEQQTPSVDSSAPISDPVAEPGAQPFQVTAEWQPVPEGAVLPGGVQVTMDMETGQQMARQAPEAAPQTAPEAVQPAPEAIQAPEQQPQQDVAPTFDPNQYLPEARRYVTEGSGRLTPEALGRHLGIEPQQAQQVLATLTTTPDSGILVGRDGRLRRAPRQTAPMDVLRFLASRGGIRDDEGHDLRRSRDLQRLVPGHGPLIRPNGLHIDDAGEALWEAGYFGDPETTPRPGEREVLDLIEEASRRRIYTPEQQEVMDARQREAWQADEEESIRQEIRNLGRELGEPLAESDIRSIMDIIAEDGLETEAAVDFYVERLALQAVDQASREDQEAAYDIPFDPVEDEQASSAPGVGARDSQPAREPGDTTEGAESRPPAAEIGRPQEQVAPPPVTEQTDQGEQVVIPGAEQRPQSEILQQQADAPLRPGVPQQGLDGLEIFDPDSRATAQQDLLDAPQQGAAAEQQGPTADVVRQRIAEAREYARGVVGVGGVRRVWMIGSGVQRADARDVDLLYEIDGTLPEATADAEAVVEEMIGETRIDIDRYDTFIKVADRYFHVATGAGNAVVENTDYAREQAGRPRELLAEAEQPAEGLGPAEPTAEPALTIADHSEKSIIITGQTRENIDRIKAAVPGVRPLWNRRAKGWIFPKKRESQVREALADLLGDAPQEPAASADAFPEQAAPEGYPEGYPVGDEIAAGGPTPALRNWIMRAPDADLQQALDQVGSDGLVSQAIQREQENRQRRLQETEAQTADGFRGQLEATGEATDAGGTIFQIRRSRDGRTWGVQTRREGEATATFRGPGGPGEVWSRDEAIRRAVRDAILPRPAERPATYGASNTLVTRERAEELRRRLREKLRGQLSSGVDPELIALGTELAVFHLEAGARSFADYSRAMVADLGEAARPYLRSWYEGARHFPGLDTTGMTPAAEIEDTPADTATPAASPATVRPDAPQESDDGVQGTVPPGDARAGAADVQPAAPDRGAGRPSEPEGGRGAADVRGADGGRPEAAQRPAGTAVPQTGGGSRPGDPDRVPAGGRSGTRGSAGEAARVKGENFTIEPGALQEGRGRVQKARDNIRAIELMREIEAEGRPATRAEQEQLALYVGWGGLKGAFPDAQGRFEKGLEQVGERLRELMSETEYATARRSMQYAHYTSEAIVSFMWEAARRMGFAGGKVFEPGMGIGNFAGLMPADIATRSDYNGLELDHTTARIARLLYPRYGVRQDDFTRVPLPKDTFDLVIGNPPFADVAVRSDPNYPQGFLLHDYFFAKSLDAVRPGGLLAFISSAGTMNKLDDGARKYLAERADLAGAIRLPGNAFEKNAGTSVTTDIIFLRKKDPNAIFDRAVPAEVWTDTTEMTLPNKDGNPHRGNVNRYFAENPDMVLGEQGFFDPLYLNRYAVRAPRDFDLEAALKRALGRLPEKIVSEPQDATDRANIDFGTSERKEGSFYLGRDGQLMQQRQGVGVPVQRRGKGVEGGRTAAEIERIEALVPVRDALRAVYAADLAEDSANAARARERLNKAYDAFVERFGPINKANFQYRRPTIIQQESARAEAREEARYAGTPWREGDFDPSEMIEAGASLSEIARARKAAREAAEKAGRPFDEGTFDPADMPDLVIEKRPNIDPFMDDPESYRLRAIEDYNDQTGEARKTDVFFKNVITREREPQISSAHDAVLYVLNKFGRLDLREVAAAAGISESQAIEELGDGIYRLPGTDNQWVTRDEYLSGNVRRKLRQARAAAQRDPSLQRNVDALEAVQPDPLPPSEISANLGMPWIPTEVIERFGTEALGLDSLNVRYIPKLAQWSVSGDTDSVAARSTWGTDKRSAPALLSDALNRQDPRIYREIRTPDGTQRELDEVATEAAQDKVRALKERFADWIWSDPERAQSLADLYNEEYNNLRVREYDGSYLTTPGISAAWRWRPHQTRVIARIIQSGNTYMAHSVGAGKTSAMIGAGMEMRRLGLVRKPMYVVPNHMLGQFTKEFYEQYPTARIAVADERRFHTSRRKQFIADVANEDLDAIIITHSAFGMIPVSEQFQDNLIQEQIAEYRQLLEEVKSEGGDNRITRSRIEKQIERLEQRLSGRAQGRRDQVYTFEEMGVDFLFVDEAHLFRKLDFATKMSNVKGISPEGSKASWDLFVKSRWLETVNPGRSLVLASGTPVTNTMAELYSLSRYLQPQELRDRGIEHFDAWAGAYGDTVTQLEQNPAGGYQPVTRFAKFVNVPELSNMVRQVMDVVTSKQLEQYVTRPRLKGGKRQMNLAEKSEQLEAYQQHLAARMQAIAARKGPPKKGDDIILNVINDGRHAAIDMRLVNPDLPNDPGSKLNLLVDNVYRIWKQSKRQKFHQPGAEGYSATPVDTGPATQMIFANLGLSSARGFSVPDYIRSELQRRGVPKDEIALIGDYKSHVAKQRLFNDMNEGKVRVLIGSTSKMATGVNAQRRLYALHNLDPLWFPADDEQRNGRILRQGNMNPEIEIHDYSTKGTYDSTMWGMMETKARFIQGFFEGDPNLRDMEDLGEASQYEQAKALTTADPRLIELTDLRQQLERARRRKAAHEREAYALKQRLSGARNDAAYWSARIPQIEADIAKRQDLRGDNFQARVDGKTYSERVEFGDLLLGRLEIMAGEQRDYSSHKIGEISGFDIIADVWGSGDNRRSALAIVREGNYEQEIKVSGSSRGLVQSIEAALRGFEGDLASARQRLERAERTIRDAEGQGETSYSGDAEIERLTERVRALERELAPKKEEAAPGEGGEPRISYTMPDGWGTAEGGTVPRPRLSNTELAAVRGIIRRVSGLRDFEQIDSIPIEAGPAAAAWGRPEGGGTAGGGYVPTRDVIILAMDSASPRAAYHESFHRLQNLFLTDREKAALEADHDRLRDLLKREGVRSAEQVDRMAGSEIEAEAFAAFATAKAEGQPVTGFPMRARMALAKIERVVRAVRNWLRGRGYQTWEDVFERAAAGEVARRLPRDAQGRFVSPSAITDTRMRYSVNEPIRPERNFPLRNPGRNAPTARNGAEARRRAMNQWLGMQPLDQAFRLPFHLFGGIDQRGEWNWGRYLNQQAERIITNAKFSDESRFAWINPALQKARAGLLDRYGLDPAYIERERQRGLDERRILAQVPEIMQMLNDQNIGMEEAKVLHAVLTGEEVADAEMAKLAEPIRNAIDDMGAEAVRYGLLSPEAYERNRGAYLHRVYQKHENDMGGLTRWVSRSMASQRKKIIGEQFKGRGLWIEVPMSRLMRDMPGFREAQRGEVVKGERLRVLDRVEHTEQEELRGISSSARKRVLDRVYLPEGEAVPPRFADYADRGVWEVRGQKGGKVVLWRDFTREERRRMGEIVDARYTIAKTYMQMAHDLAVGKFYHDIAQNEDWSQAKEPADGKVVDALEFGRFDRVGRTDVEWVRVPDTKIANSQTKRYGALAGRYLRAEIWRDIQELERMQNPTFWNQALTQWKLNKTARNPVVHMNNVMSNLALMDLADVRSSDLVNAIASMVNRDDAFLEAQENGAFGSDMVAVEIRRNTLQPILERIQRESQGGRNTIESKLGLLGRLADGIWGFAKGFDRRMVELYQLEDEVFRMATYLRKRDLGFSPTEAALQARDQFLNYDIRAPWVNAARRSVLPFISYTYRAVPVVAQSVMLRPWKLAKYATIAYAANALAYMVLGDEGDEDEERRSLRTEEQGSTWLGAPRMMRLPWNDDYGNPVFLDVRRWVPAGDIFDMNQGQSAIPVPAPLQFGGPLMLAGEFILNRQAFTGQEITNDLTDDWWDKSAKVTDWAWKSWMPSAPWIPGSWYWERIGNAMSGARDFRGRPYSVPQAVLSSAGIKVKPQDVRQGFYFHGLEFNRVEQELRAQMRRLARDRQRGLITERRFERERVRLITKMRRLGERRRQVFQGSD